MNNKNIDQENIKRKNLFDGRKPETGEKSVFLSRGRLYVIIPLALAAVGTVGYFWHYGRTHESTDDAVIEGHVLPVSPKISGQICAVHVRDNQDVKKGDLIVEIDPRDYQLRLEQSRAELEAAAAEARRAAADSQRYARLYKRDQVSKQIYDKAVADAEVLRAREELARSRSLVAELDLSYTKISAAESGRVSRKSVEPGEYVQPGAQMLAIVPSKVWVVANFKETQLEKMRAGQPVSIRVDTYSDRVFKGHVDSIQSGTGSRFSLLPAENATGNFVKVVQRVPVKIVFDGDVSGFRLVPGMSVVPTVKVS